MTNVYTEWVNVVHFCNAWSIWFIPAGEGGGGGGAPPPLDPPPPSAQATPCPRAHVCPLSLRSPSELCGMSAGQYEKSANVLMFHCGHAYHIGCYQQQVSMMLTAKVRPMDIKGL